MVFLYSVRSRVCIVPFSAPMIAASTGDQLAAFDDVLEMVEQNLLSQALGWIIRQATTVCDMEQLWNAMDKLENAFQGRALMNWGLVALTTSKVSMITTAYKNACFCSNMHANLL